jgi:hypothetical protein
MKKPPSKVAHNRPPAFLFNTCLAAQTAQKQKSRTPKSPLMQGMNPKVCFVFVGGGRFSRPRALPSSMIRTPSSGTLQQHAPRSISVPPGCETGCGSRTGSPGGGSVTSSIGSPITTPGFPSLPPAPGSAPGSARFANPGPPYHGKFFIFQKKNVKNVFQKNVQLNEYETDRYFLQNFQCKTVLHAFCKICEHEIVLQKSKQKQFQIHNSYKTRE